MNGTTSPAPAAPVLTAAAVRLESAVIDASCRPLLLPIFSGAAWLLISTLFALLTSIKLHAPTLLADGAWFTYGHTLAVARDTFAYGFASQLGLAVALWMLCRLGATTLFGGIAIAIGTAFWNLGVLAGSIGILSGHSTGFEWLEFPSAGSAVLLGAYILIGLCAFVTLRARNNAELYVSQWYVIGALLVFPWFYTAARLLLVWYPVRGVMQVLVNQWFAHGFLVLWLGSLGLATLFYFIPKLTGAPLFSRTLAVLGFWTMFIFGPWAGLYRGLPLPSWIISASVAAAVVLMVPLIANVVNLWSTLAGPRKSPIPLLAFFKASVVFLAIAGTLHIAMLLCPDYIRLTLFADGIETAALYGFIGFALVGAMQYIVPLLSGDRQLAPSLKLIFWSLLGGTVIYAAAMMIGGLVQGKKLADGSIPFIDVMNATKMSIRMSTLGLLLLVVAAAALCAHAVAVARRCCPCCGRAPGPTPVRPPAKVQKPGRKSR